MDSSQHKRMWLHRALKEDQLRSGVTLPALSNSRTLLPHRPQLQYNRVLRLEEEVACNLSANISQIPSATRNVMRHLSSRHTEVSNWQAQISESIERVNREILAVEQVKDTAECYLQDRQLYGKLMGDCVAVKNGASSADLTQDPVFSQLKREEQLTAEVRELLQKQICILLNKRSSLNAIHSQLLADFQDKGEAIKLTTKCIAHEADTPMCSSLPAGQYKPNYMSYDKWLSHCKALRLTADNLIKDSSAFRGNLRFTLANLKNAQERQCRRTADSLKRKINELGKVQYMMLWEKQQIMYEISDLAKNIQRMMGQISTCDSKLHQATHRLDILNQRPGRELCLDMPHISLTLEKDDLSKMASGLRPVLRGSQQQQEITRRRLMILEHKLDKNAHALEVEQKCLKLHQSFLPALDTTVVLANKPKLRTTTGHTSALAYLQ